MTKGIQKCIVQLIHTYKNMNSIYVYVHVEKHKQVQIKNTYIYMQWLSWDCTQM